MLQLPIKTFSTNHAAGIAKSEQELFAIHGTRATLAVPMLIALNTFNRNVYMETPELLVDTTAGKLDLGLNFNSCTPTEQHWRFNFLSELRLETGSPDNHYVFTDPSGSETIYSYDATSGHYIAPKDSDHPQSYIEVTAIGVDWYDPHSNHRKCFESRGALLRQSAIIAANGQSLRFNYAAGTDRIESIYDAQADCYYRVNYSGNSISISHEKTTQGRTSTNLLVQYNFNRLFERLERIKSYSTDLSQGRTTSSYDTSIAYSTNITGHIYTITQPDGTVYQLDCNRSGQLKYIYLTNDKRPYYSIIQQDDKTLVYIRPFDDSSSLQRVFGGGVKENHQGICFTHTADGRYKEITNALKADMLEEGDSIEREYVTAPTAKTFDWTADKQLETVFHADLSKTQYEYHASGALKTETVLDRNLAVVSKTEFSYNSFGAVIELQQTVNATTVETTHFYYDETLEAESGSRRLLYKVLPGGRVEQYLYDDKGMQTTTKQFTNTLAYIPTQEQLAELSAWCESETASLNFIFVQRTFNDYGQVESRSHIDEETFSHGLAGEVLTHNKHNSSGTSITESFSFHPANRLARQTDFLQRVTIHTYEKNQQTLQHHDGQTTVNGFNSSAQITASQTTGEQGSKTTKVQKIYNDAGQVIAELLSNGQTRINLYDNAGDLRFSVDQSGVVTELNYSPANGAHEAIIYGKKLDLTTVKFSELIDTTTADSPTISAANYQKLRSHILTSSATLSTSADRYHQEVIHANGQIEFEIKRQDDDSYSVVHHQYDAKGREISVTAYARTLSKDQVDSLATSHQWNSDFLDETNDRVTQRIYQNGALAFEIDPRGVTTAFVYDGAGQEIARYSGNIAMSDAKFQTAQPSLYDDASVITTLKYYNSKGLVYRQIDAEGYVTDFDYYANGELHRSHRYLANIENLSGLSYEQLATQVMASSDEDKVIQYQYDDLGRCCTESHLNDDYVISREWDEHDNLIKEIKRDSASETVSGDTYRETQTRYDDLNRVVASINPLVTYYASNFKYDDALTEAEKAAKKQQLLNTYALHTTYTSQGLVATTEKQNGGKRYYFYDDANQLICEMDKSGHATQYQYDAFGNVAIKSIAKIVDATNVTKLLAKADDHHISASDLSELFKSAHQTIYKYYSSGLVKSVTDPQGFSKSYQYNAFGETISEQQQITQAIAADEDEEEKVEQEDELSAQAATYLIHRYEYDKAGNKTKIIQANSIDEQVIETTHEYNHPLNLCTASQTDDGERALTEFDRLGRKIADKIETRDVTTKVLSTETIATIEEYDAFDRIISERDYSDADTYSETAHSYQRKARKETITNGTQVASVIHNAFGEKIKSYIGEQEQQRWQHNALGLMSAQHKRTNDVLLQTDVWTYYVDAKLAEHSLYDRRSFYIKKYKYDYGWQLRAIEHSSQIKIGEETQTTELGSETFSYDCHQAVSRQTSLAGNTTTFERDGSGRVICKTVDPDGLNIQTKSSYNGLGQTLMESIGDSKYPEKYQQQFTHDVFGRKDGSILDPGGIHIHTSKVLNKSGLVTKEINGEGHATHFVLDDRGNKILSISPSGIVNQFEYDLQNRVTSKHRYQQRIDIDTAAEYITSNDIAGLMATVDSLYTKDDLQFNLFYNEHGKRSKTIRHYYDYDNKLYKGFVYQYGYDDNGNQISTRAFSEQLTFVECRDNPLRAGLTDLPIQVAALELDHQNDRMTHYFTDPQGNKLFTLSETGQITQNYFDHKGRVIHSIRFAESLPVDAIQALNQSQATLAAWFQAHSEPEVSTLSDYLSQQGYYTADNEHSHTVYGIQHGKPLYHIAANGLVVKTDYNGDDQKIQQIHFEKKFDFPLTISSDIIKAINNTLQSDYQLSTEATSNDRVYKIELDAANRIKKEIDPYGLIDDYERDCAGLIKIHTDRAGYKTYNEYDKARRHTAEELPQQWVTHLTTKKNADGSMVLSAERINRRIRNELSVNRLNKTIGKSLDARIGTTTYEIDTRNVTVNYDLDGEEIGIAVAGVKVDDATQNAGSDLTVLPTKTVDIETCKVLNSGKKVLVEYKCIKSDATDSYQNMHFYIYDALGYLSFEILPNRSVIQYKRNEFGQEQDTIRYGDLLISQEFLNSKTTTGISHEEMQQRLALDITPRIAPSSDIRSSHFEYHANGLLKSVSKTKRDYYNPISRTFEKGEPTTESAYDGLGRLISQKTLQYKSPTEVWHKKYFWYLPGEKKACMTAESFQPSNGGVWADNFKLTKDEFDVFGDHIKTHELDSAVTLTGARENIDLNMVSALFESATNIEKDVVQEFRTAKNGKQSELIEKDIEVADPATLVAKTKTVTTLTKDLTTQFKYGKRDEPTEIIHPNGAKEWFFYDANKNKVAQVGMPVLHFDEEAQQEVTIYPLQVFYYNAHGEQVQSVKYRLGCDPALLGDDFNPYTLPTEIKAATNNGLWHSEVRDNRGVVMIEQKGHTTTNLTYDHNKSLVRSYLKRKKAASDGTGYHIDETRLALDQKGNVLELSKYRNGIKQNALSTVTLYNAYDENVSQYRAHKTADQIKHKMLQGLAWMSHDLKTGAPELHFSDLMGNRTLSLKARDFDLNSLQTTDEAIAYANAHQTWKDHQREEYIPNTSGDELTHYPAAHREMQPASVTSELVAQDIDFKYYSQRKLVINLPKKLAGVADDRIPFIRLYKKGDPREIVPLREASADLHLVSTSVVGERRHAIIDSVRDLGGVGNYEVEVYYYNANHVEGQYPFHGMVPTHSGTYNLSITAQDFVGGDLLKNGDGIRSLRYDVKVIGSIPGGIANPNSKVEFLLGGDIPSEIRSGTIRLNFKPGKAQVSYMDITFARDKNSKTFLISGDLLVSQYFNKDITDSVNVTLADAKGNTATLIYKSTNFKINADGRSATIGSAAFRYIVKQNRLPQECYLNYDTKLGTQVANKTVIKTSANAFAGIMVYNEPADKKDHNIFVLNVPAKRLTKKDSSCPLVWPEGNVPVASDHYIGITYDTHHRGVDIHDVRGGHTQTGFTNRGNAKQITYPVAGQAVPITPANTAAAADRTYKHARLSKVERRFHDEMNKLVAKQTGYQDEGVTTIAFDPITLYERMQNGQLLRITDPHGALRSEQYRDGFDQPSSYRGYGAKKRWQLTYSANQLVEILIPNVYLNGKEQQEGNISKRETLSYKLIYDHTDELIGLYVPWEKVKKDGKDVWTYAQMNFRYDANGQISHRIMPASTGAGIQETKIQRDALGKEIYVVSPINAEAGIDGDFSDRQSSIASLSAFDRQIVNTIVSAKKKSTLYVRNGMTSAIDRSLDSSGDDWTYTRNFFGTLNRVQQTGRGRARNQDHALPLNKYYELETTKIAEIGSVGKTHVQGKGIFVPLGHYEYTWEGDMLVKQDDKRLNIETSYKRDYGLEITTIEHKDKSGKVIDKTNRTIDILGRCILSSTYRLDASGSATMAFSKAQHFDLEARRIIISLTMHAYPKITIQFGYGYDPAGHPLHDCVPIYINGNRFTLKKPSATQGKYYIYDSYGEPIHETYHHGVDVTNFFDDLMRINRSEVKGCFTTDGTEKKVTLDVTRHPSGYVSQQVPKHREDHATITKMTKNFVATYKGDKKYKFFKRLEAGHIMEDGLTPTKVDHYDADVDAGKTPEHHENYVYKYMFELGQAIPTSYAGQGEDLTQKLTGYSRITVPYYIGQILAATGSDIRGTSRDDVGSMDEVEKLSVAQWADETCVITITTILNCSGYNYRQTHHLFVNEQGMVEGELVTTDLGPDEKYVTERTGGVIPPDAGKNNPQYVTYKDSKGVSHYQKFMGQYVIKPRGMFRIDHDYEDAYFKSAVKLGASTAAQARAAIASFTDLESMQEEKVELEAAPAVVLKNRRALRAEVDETVEPETLELTAEQQAEIAQQEALNAEHEAELEKLLTLTHIRPEEYIALQATIDAMPKRDKTQRPGADGNYYLPANFFERLRTDADLQQLQDMLQAMFATRSAQQCYEFLTELATSNDCAAIAHYIPRQPSIAHAFSLLMCAITESLDELEQTTMALHYEKINQQGDSFEFGEALNHSAAIAADLPGEIFTEETTSDGILDERDRRTLQAVKTATTEEYRQWLKDHPQPQQQKGWFSFFGAGKGAEDKSLLQFWAPTFERGKLRESSLITMINKYHQHPPHAVLNDAALQLGFSHLPILMREQTPAMYYMVIRELVYRGAQDKDVRFSIKGFTVFNKVVNKARSQLAGHEAEFNRLISRSLAKHPQTTSEPPTVAEHATTRLSGAAGLMSVESDREAAAKEATAISTLSSSGTVGNGFATGLKIGELHDSSPLITRLATDPTWRNIKEETLISDIEKELPPHMVAILNLMFPDGKLPAGLSIPAEPSTMPTDQEIMGDVNTVVASLMHLGNPSISYYDQYLENLNQDDGEMWGMFAMVVAGAVTVLTLGTSTPLMAAAVASGSDAGLQALGMAVGANHKFNITETIAAGLGAAVGSGAGQLTSDLLGKAGNTFTQLLTERVAAAAAQNATSQLTRFALSGGRVNFNKQAFYSAIATAAASAAIEFNLGGNKEELSTSRNKYTREQVRAKVLSSLAGDGIDAAINHRDIKLDRLIANAITSGIVTAAETSDVKLGITHRPDPTVQSTKGGATNRYQQKIEKKEKATGKSQGVPTITVDAGGGSYTHYTGEGGSSSEIHSVDKAEGDLAAQEFYQHWDYYLPPESSLTPSISTNSAKPAEIILSQFQQQVEQNPGAPKHAPESKPMDYGSWQLKPAPSKWQRFKTGFWSGIDATNRSYEHTMGSLVAPVRGLKYLYDHPDAITKGINYVSSHPGEVVASIGNSLERTATKFANGDTFTKYEMLLNGFSDTVTGTFTGGAAAKATTTAAAAGTKLVGATLTHTKSAGLLLAGIVKTGEKVPNRGASSFVLHEAALEIKKLPSPRDFMLHNVENPKLRKMINFLYRDRAKVGNGGTADILRKEFLTGELYSPKGHLQKAIEARKSIKRIINSNTLNERELQIAHQMRQELHEAISHESWDKMYPNRLEMRR